ncbi:MAG: VanZ family protein [Pseudomonadota bacterium]|nr:VanZ family protein [Pseudomonadota bacterium]MEC7136217.1 VanZ family protein [Pseudomonadota bacterium]
MKNNISLVIKCLFYFSLIILLILYLFPGSLIGYILYGNLGRQPDFISNPIGTSINHLIFFFYLSTLGFMFRSNKKKFINSFSFLFLISIILELLHYFIPNRAFELIDLYANSLGVLLAFFVSKLFKKT